MFWVLLFLFLMGLIWGSFLNVVIYRSSVGKTLGGRSECPDCGHVISWYYNIPLLSYLYLRGRCAYCHKKISLRYPAIELMTGILFVWWYLVGFNFFKLFGNPWMVAQPVFWLVVGMILLTIFMTDLLYGVIPLEINATLLSLAFIYRLSLAGFGIMVWSDFWSALFSGLGLALFFLFLQKVTRYIKGVDGLGDGDIALSPALGLLLGWPKLLIAVFLSFTIGSLVGVYLIITKKKNISNTIPFGPFLVTGTILALVFGAQIWSWYMGMLQ